jgi:hypothetical protein
MVSRQASHWMFACFFVGMAFLFLSFLTGHHSPYCTGARPLTLMQDGVAA